MVIGEMIKDARANAGISLRELARRAGMNPTQLSEIERGLKGCTTETLQRIADALGKEIVLRDK